MANTAWAGWDKPEPWEDTKGQGFFCNDCNRQVFDDYTYHHTKDRFHVSAAKISEKRLKRDEWCRTQQRDGLLAITGTKTGKANSFVRMELTPWLKVCKTTLLGLDSVYEVIPRSTEQHRYYVCTLCGSSEFQVFAHMIHPMHIMNYFEANKDVSEPFVKVYLQQNPSLVSLMPTDISLLVNLSLEDTKRMTSMLLEISDTIAEYMVAASLPEQKPILHVELGDGKAFRSRQPPLWVQIPGHTTDHYPPAMRAYLSNVKVNFGGVKENIAKKKVRMAAALNPHANFGPVTTSLSQISSPEDATFSFDAQGNGTAPNGVSPVTMGQLMGKDVAPVGALAASATNNNKPVALLQWLEISEHKLLALRGCPIDPRGFNLCDRINSWLDSAVRLFMTPGRPAPSDICFNYKSPADPKTMLLATWLDASDVFLENAWFCSQREVACAEAVMALLERATGRCPPPPPFDPFFDEGYGFGGGYGGGPFRGRGGRGGGRGGGYGGDRGHPYGRKERKPLDPDRKRGPVNGEECYFWRTSGCRFADKCKHSHLPENEGVDKKDWMPGAKKNNGNGDAPAEAAEEEEAEIIE